MQREYGCGCIVESKSHGDAFMFCPTHELVIVRASHVRQTISGRRFVEINEWSHDEQCLYLQLKAERQVRAYRATWPAHCKDCSGWGGRFVEYDPSPSGVALSPGTMTDWDACGTCTENMICGRCFGELVELEDDLLRCTGCGFKPGENAGEPEFYSCEGACELALEGR